MRKPPEPESTPAEAPIRVRNRLQRVEDVDAAADLYRRILQAVTMAERRRRREEQEHDDAA